MLTPQQIAASGTEHALQAAVFQWIALNGQRYPEFNALFAIPNGGGRAASVGASMRAEGVKPGVPDLCYPRFRHGWPGLWLEMKTPAAFKKTEYGRSDKQIAWHKLLREQHYAVAVCDGWEQVIFCLMLYEGGWWPQEMGDLDAFPVDEACLQRWAFPGVDKVTAGPG